MKIRTPEKTSPGVILKRGAGILPADGSRRRVGKTSKTGESTDWEFLGTGRSRRQVPKKEGKGSTVKGPGDNEGKWV